MQIRTGEGKSMILGAVAAMLGLLGLKVRTVCYSEYLSSRDYDLFEDVFSRFGIKERICYSTIKLFALDSIDEKGDIFALTKSFMRGRLAASNISSDAISNLSNNFEVLLVDKVDILFGKEFHGKTLKPVISIKEPEVSEILMRIWNAFNQGGRSLQLCDIQSMPEYSRLLQKLPGHQYYVDNQISRMLSQVGHVDTIPYHLDQDTDKIGYTELDSISYSTEYGYLTVFAYLKESENLRTKDITLEKVLAMKFRCGQFSYVNISPYRIIGVSGTLHALGSYEKTVLGRYNLNKFTYIPSVYSGTNFMFDKAGRGIYLEKSESDFNHRLLTEITQVTRSDGSVIVFFPDNSALQKFVDSPVFRRLGRHKNTLTELTNSTDKEYIINKAATAGQITLSTAIFGRGTDFFCKDETVEKSGGVRIIQTFLSKDLSDEVQIQGRTARQGKHGSYQLVLLESDLERDFDESRGENQIAHEARYE
jgi:hypothetical protein